MNSWLTSGLVTVASVTTTMGAFEVMINDKVKKTYKDFYSSPAKRSKITAGYLGSAFTIGIIMSVITFAAMELYIVLNGGSWADAATVIKVILIIFLSSASNTALICFIVSFFKSQNAFGTASSIIGTLIGFLTGIYIPIGVLPQAVQTIIKIFPASHAASLLRQVLMDSPMQISFAGAPAEQVANFKEFIGVTYSFGNSQITPLVSILILVFSTAFFFALAVLNLSRKNQRVKA